uniref:Uncharacterized protein n=1 Tax=Anguilla anguilla TaxID=7936 RepID=A0A0E9XDU6_ANGAN
MKKCTTKKVATWRINSMPVTRVCVRAETLVHFPVIKRCDVSDSAMGLVLTQCIGSAFPLREGLRCGENQR